jgi:MFS family permease
LKQANPEVVGFLANRIGRKGAIIVSQGFLGIGIVFMVVCKAGYPCLLIIGRTMAGISSGIGNTIVPMFLSEFAIPESRGAIITMHQLFITFGILVSNVLGLTHILGNQELWEYVFVTRSLSVVVSLATLSLYPNPPLYLLSIGDLTRGKSSLGFYRMKDDVEIELQNLTDESQKYNVPSTGCHCHCELFGPNLRRRTLIACGLQV